MAASLPVGWIIAGLAASVLAPLLALALKHWYFDAQKRLRVTVRVWRSKQSSAVQGVLKAEFERLWEVTNDENRKRRETIDVLQNTDSYVEIDIHNKSRKRIEAISAVLADVGFGIAYQIDEGQTVKTKKNQRIEIGNLQPGHGIKVHLWCYTDYSHVGFDINKTLTISADEVDRITYRSPAPGYLAHRYHMRAIWSFNIIEWTAIIGLYTWNLLR
jgi:hypothetical protein